MQASLELIAASCVSFHKADQIQVPRHHKHSAGSTRRKETPEEPQPQRLRKVSHFTRGPLVGVARVSQSF